MAGDLTDASSLGPALEDADAVVFTHGANGRPPGPAAIDAAHDAPNMPLIAEPEHIRAELERFGISV